MIKSTNILPNPNTANLIDELYYLSKDVELCFKNRDMIKDSSERMNELLELVDSCYEIIEIFEAKGEGQVNWKKRWLEKARECGATSF